MGVPVGRVPCPTSDGVLSTDQARPGSVLREFIRAVSASPLRNWTCADAPLRRFISTMETETISSRNIVDLLLQEEFGVGICGKLMDLTASEETLEPEPVAAVSGGEQKESGDFVIGWDC